MLKTRVITAVVLLAVLLPVTLFAPVAAFGALIAVALVLGAWEWARLLALPHVQGDLSRVNIDPRKRDRIVARYGV